MHAKSTDELISFGFSDRSSRKFGGLREIVQTKNDFTFWLIFDMSPNLELSESLDQRKTMVIQNDLCPISSRIFERSDTPRAYKWWAIYRKFWPLENPFDLVLSQRDRHTAGVITCCQQTTYSE